MKSLFNKLQSDLQNLDTESIKKIQLQKSLTKPEYYTSNVNQFIMDELDDILDQDKSEKSSLINSMIDGIECLSKDTMKKKSEIMTEVNED